MTLLFYRGFFRRSSEFDEDLYPEKESIFFEVMLFPIEEWTVKQGQQEETGSQTYSTPELHHREQLLKVVTPLLCGRSQY